MAFKFERYIESATMNIQRAITNCSNVAWVFDGKTISRAYYVLFLSTLLVDSSRGYGFVYLASCNVNDGN